MTEPLVCAVMLTCDRPEMAARAVRSFRAQTYERKTLLVWNTGESDEIECGCGPTGFHVVDANLGQSIGMLRNSAIGFPTGYDKPDIIAHFDDDDYSHPDRIAEQVALLQSSGADAVGYREMLFWRETSVEQPRPTYPSGEHKGERVWRDHDEAWLYSHNQPNKPNHVLGTSLCYWRKTWERKPFPDAPKGPGASGEDWLWQQGLNVKAASAMFEHGESTHPDTCDCGLCGPGQRTVIHGGNCEPRMIASIHGQNSSQAYNLELLIAKGSREWRRVPEWDDYARGKMQL